MVFKISNHQEGAVHEEAEEEHSNLIGLCGIYNYMMTYGRRMFDGGTVCFKERFCTRSISKYFVSWPTIQIGLQQVARSAMAERPRKLGDFKKAPINGGTDNDSLNDSHKSLRCR